MTDNQREIAETVFERNQRRELEINDALKQEYARREVAIKNMYRLRALRLAREVPSRFVLEFGDAISGISRVPSQAARSIGWPMDVLASVLQPSIFRMLI
jgi:hypothetical protein